MDQIKVNTAELRISAHDLNGSANDINAVINQLLKNDIGNAYNGQLKNAVTGIISDAHPKAVQLQNRSWELRDELVQRADRFEAVNEAGSSVMINVSHQINDFIDSSPILKLFGSISKSDLAKASFIWGLGGFGGLIGLIAILPRIWSIITKKRVAPAPTPVPTPTPPKSETAGNSDQGKNQDQNTTTVSEAQLPILGALSQRYESNGDPGRVSSGVGDPGGVSYGAYQMTSKGGGTVARFLKSDAASPWASEFAGLTPGSKEFSDKWKEVAARDHDKFLAAQHEYIRSTYYEPLSLKAGKLGINVQNRSRALQNVIWSTSVQHGANTNIINLALQGKNASTMSDEEIIKAIYAERGRTSPDGTLVHFSSSSSAIQKGVANRFKNELSDALRMLSEEKGKPL